MLFSQQKFEEDNRFRNVVIFNKKIKKYECKDLFEIPENQKENCMCYYTKKSQQNVCNSLNNVNIKK